MHKTKQKWPRATALAVAEEICNALKPVTEWLIVAGSLRRGKQEVGDAEIVFIPKLAEKVKEQAGLFGTFEQIEFDDLAERRIQELLDGGTLAKRPSKIGVFTWGPENKLAIHVPTGMPVDLFATTADKKFNALVIRTGSAEMNRKLAISANKIGRSLNANGDGVTVTHTVQADGCLVELPKDQQTKIRSVSERHVFELVGIPYLEPEDR
jgi:DNA polymerase/3'-5' exonuclease PolX